MDFASGSTMNPPFCPIAGVFLLLSAGALPGCASRDPIDAWQDSLTTYVAREGHGDPTILRDSPQLRSSTSLRPAAIQFSKLDVRGSGLPPFIDRWDVHGVMLDSKNNELGAYPFLIGIVKRPYAGASTVEDIRLVLFEIDGDDFRWRVSRPDVEAVQRYLEAVAADDGTRLPAHASHQVFPALDDVFAFQLEGNTAIARDERSGATWRVALRERTSLSSLIHRPRR